MLIASLATAYVSSTVGYLGKEQDRTDATFRRRCVYMEDDDSNLRVDGSWLADSRDGWMACFVRDSIRAWPLDFSSVGGMCICRVAWGCCGFCFDVARRSGCTRVGNHLVVKQHRAATDRPICRDRFSNRQLDRRVFGSWSFVIAQGKNADEVVRNPGLGFHRQFFVPAFGSNLKAILTSCQLVEFTIRHRAF